LPVATFTYADTGTVVYFTGNSANTTSWSWDFGDGSSGTQQNPAHAYVAVGTYTVCLVVFNDCGTDSTCQDITLTSTIFIEEMLKAGKMVIYPNPFNQSTRVVFSNKEKTSYELVLYDVLGNQVRVMENITANEVIIEKGSLAPGEYFIELQGEAKTFKGRVMVE
jgi:uncharacterized membrane protein